MTNIITDKDIVIIRESYKQTGLSFLSKKDYDNAIKYFYYWQYAYYTHLKLDKYEYDFEILNAIEDNLKFFNLNAPKCKISQNEKIKIVYLVHGILNSSSIVPKILLNIIKHHNKSIFEIHVFTTENWWKIKRNSGNIFIKQFKELKCKMHYAPLFLSNFSKLQYIATKMYNLKPHILITTAALADFEHFFISAFKPAPIRIGFILGTPAQFISPSFDYGITWENHIIANSPILCLNSGIPYCPQKKSFENLLRSDYNLPDDAVIISSAGRYPKFQNKQLLNLILKSMETLPKLHYVIIGPLKHEIILDIPEIFKNRVHLIEWSEDYEKYLSLSDIYLDTYPSGGGITLFDAALLHLPIISFTDSSFESFDQSNWNPAAELFSDDPLILIDRNNISEIILIITKLYYDIDFRMNMGNKAYTSVIKIHDNIQESISKIENLYINLVNRR